MNAGSHLYGINCLLPPCRQPHDAKSPDTKSHACRNRPAQCQSVTKKLESHTISMADHPSCVPERNACPVLHSLTDWNTAGLALEGRERGSAGSWALREGAPGLQVETWQSTSRHARGATPAAPTNGSVNTSNEQRGWLMHRAATAVLDFLWLIHCDFKAPLSTRDLHSSI